MTWQRRLEAFLCNPQQLRLVLRIYSQVAGVIEHVLRHGDLGWRIPVTRVELNWFFS